MNPALLIPAGLLALAALLLPLLLHLARREESRPVDFAALRWLTPRLRPRRHLRFEERLLLALRLLLLALLALLLARPVLYGSGTDAPWIVAVPGVAPDVLQAAGRASAGAAASDGVEPVLRWLAPGFPESNGAAQPAPGPFPSLLRELDMRMPEGAPLTVLVPPVLEGADAERPRLSRPVDWRVVDAPPADATADATPVDTTSHVSSSRPAPRLAIRYAPERADAVRFLRAVALAWQAREPADRIDTAATTPPDPSPVDIAAIASSADGAAPGTDVDVLAWLAPGELPAHLLEWIEAGGIALVDHETRVPMPGAAVVSWQDDEGRALLRSAALGRGQVVQWARPLQPSTIPALLEADFPQRLADVLGPPPAPSRVRSDEYAPVVDAALGPWPQSARELSPWLALAVALLFVLERWLAAGPRRERHA